jgi:hypothetical protein
VAQRVTPEFSVIGATKLGRRWSTVCQCAASAHAGSGCYSRLARINTFAGVFIAAVFIILACVMGVRETPLHDLRQHQSPQHPTD